ncbi:hypothetical protein EPN96_06620 [bacterium]|nr:MAG: hypothetical protein EPN96_06620 [bacterium]
MSEVIYVGHNAEISFVVRDSSGEELNLTTLGVTRVVFHLAGVTVDSLERPGSFDFVTGGALGRIDIDLTGIAFPSGSFGARLVIYYPAKEFGVVIADGYPVNVGAAIR